MSKNLHQRMSLFLMCHNTMTATTLASSAACGLSESKSCSQAWERQLVCNEELHFQFCSGALWHLLCTKNSILVPYFPFLPPLHPASQHSGVLWGGFRFARQTNLTHAVRAHLAVGAQAHPPPAYLSATPGSRVRLGKKGRVKETWDPNLKPFGKV